MEMIGLIVLTTVWLTVFARVSGFDHHFCSDIVLLESHGRWCFFIKHSQTHTLNEAACACEDEKYALAEITSYSIYQLILKHTEARTCYWLDLTLRNGTWEWSSGAELDNNIIPWNSSNPSGNGKNAVFCENGLEKVSRRGLDDLPENYKAGVLCQRFEREPDWTTDISDPETCKSACQKQFGSKPLVTDVHPSGKEYHFCAANSANQGIRGGSKLSDQNLCFTSCCQWDICTEQSHYRCLCETNGLKWFKSHAEDCDKICKEQGIGGAVISGIFTAERHKGMKYYVCRLNISGTLVGGHTGTYDADKSGVSCHVADQESKICNSLTFDFECLCKTCC